MFGLASSTISSPFAYDPELKLLGFILEGKDCGVLFGVGCHELL